MRKSKLTSAFVIATMVAASLHLSAKPAAAADSGSFCAQLAAIQINIESSMAPGLAKDLAIAAIYGTKRAALCVE
jgi:hypothetical protein